MPKLIDMVGKQFGRLFVVVRASNNKADLVCWWCECDCGEWIVVQANSFQTNNTRSCGCLSREVNATRNLKHSHAKRGKVTPEYIAWRNMLGRANNKNGHCPAYADVSVCFRWQNSFEAFLKDVGPRPNFLHSIDRIDVFGDYEPNNVRWADRSTQANNCRIHARQISIEVAEAALQDVFGDDHQVEIVG